MQASSLKLLSPAIATPSFLPSCSLSTKLLEIFVVMGEFLFCCFCFIILVNHFYCVFKKLLSMADGKLRNKHTNYTSNSFIIKFKRRQITLSNCIKVSNYL